MKRILTTFFLIAMPVLAFAGIEGKWLTEKSDETGHALIIEVSQCGTAYCGVVVANTAGTDHFVGQQLIAGMVTDDGFNYKNGTIRDPEKDKTYRSKMYFDGTNLKVSGCIGPICRSQIWTRQ